MSKKKVDTYLAIRENFVIPLFSSDDVGKAVKVFELVYESGFRVIEFTHRAERSYQVFCGVLERYKPADFVVGVGSIVDEPTAGMYISSGADFIVGPTLSEGVMKLCNRRNILYIPGCGSLNEMQLAYELGAIVVKIFPAGSVGGKGFIKAIKAPCKWIEPIPTGGVEPTEGDLKEWKEAGAFAVGMGSKLISKDLVENDKWDELKVKFEKLRKIILSL